MPENTDALTPPMPTETGIKSLANLLESVPPQYRQEFGSGHLIIGDGLEIKGEGEERKLHVTINPDDPEYQKFQEDFPKEVERIQAVSEDRVRENRYGMSKVSNTLQEAEAELITRRADPNADDEEKKILGDLERDTQDLSRALSTFNDTTINWALDSINVEKKYLIESGGVAKLERVLLDQGQKLLDQLALSIDDPLRSKQIQEDFDRNTALLSFCRQFDGRTIYALAEPKKDK